MNHVGENIKKLRDFKNINQRDLAYKASTSTQTLSAIENNPEAKSKFIPRIALALGVQVETLLSNAATNDYISNVTDRKIAQEIEPQSNMSIAELIRSHQAIVSSAVADVMRSSFKVWVSSSFNDVPEVRTAVMQNHAKLIKQVKQDLELGLADEIEFLAEIQAE